MTRRILLASLKVGGGHTALRDSFAQALRRSDPTGERFELDLHESYDPFSLNFYTWCVRKAPRLQGLQYTLSSKELLVRILSKNLGAIANEAKELLTAHSYDAVICTHFLFTQAFVRARNELGLTTRIVTAIPDYGPPTNGFFPKTDSIRPDHAIVMDDRCRDHLAHRRELPPSVLHLSGFLTREPFTRLSAQLSSERRFGKAQRQAIAAGLVGDHPQLASYDPSKPTLIFLGGSAWTEKTLPVLEELLKDEALLSATNILVVVGANPDFEAVMRQKAKGHPGVAVFGLVPPEVMASLVALSDYPVLGSIAPATMHELLELRCGPFFLFSFIPGSENAHIPYIRDRRIGLYEPKAKKMVGLIREALGFKPRSPELERLIGGFPAEAQGIRSAHKERAMALPEFLGDVFRAAPASLALRRRRAWTELWRRRASH